jgi:pimeloyl-ACP methyl ester carboxylesterase
LDEAAEYDYDFHFTERWFEPESNVRIHAIHAFTERDSAKGLVLYLHGNRGSNRTNSDRYKLFLENGYDMIYPDYRKFGKSRGNLENEDDLVGDIQFVFEELSKEYGQENITIVGYSLGSGVAAQVAKLFDPKRLILWTPFYSLVDVKNTEFPFLPDRLLKYPLRTDLALKKIEEPVHLLYASDDELLPVERSINLTDYLKEGDTHTVIEGQGHGWFYRNKIVQQHLKMILSE